MSEAVVAPNPCVVLINSQKDKIREALPLRSNLDRFVRAAVTEIRKNPDLAACDPLSVMNSVVSVAQLGLELGATLGQAYLIPYDGVCTPQIGYKGWVALARRSEQISTLFAECVYADDQFECVMGTEPKIVHIPKFKTKTLTHIYAICRFRDGGVQFLVMTKEDIESIRTQFSHKKNKAWNTSYDEMAKKTALKRLMKTLPVSVELADAIELEGEEEPEPTKEERDEKREDIIEAESVDTVAGTKVANELFYQLHKEATEAKIATQDLYTSYDLAVKSFDEKKLIAICEVLKNRLRLEAAKK